MAKIVVGNMKNALNKSDVSNYINAIENTSINNVNLILCPSYIHLNLFKGNNYELGAQNVYFSDDLCTGEVSINQLNDLCVKYIIVGHAERREKLKEDDTVNRKLKLCLNNGIKPILCIGERKKDDSNVNIFNAIKEQILDGLLDIEPNDIKDIIIAYEPVHAIGTDSFIDINKITTIKEYIDSIIFDVYKVKCKIIYGGSVNKNNIEDIVSVYDGVMVGKLCTNYNKFFEVLKNI